MNEFPLKVKKYIRILFLLAGSLVFYLFANYRIVDLSTVLVLGFLSVIGESFLIMLPNVGGISITLALDLATIMIGGPLTAIVVTSIGFLFRFPYVEERGGYVHALNTPLYKTLFNVSQGVLSTGVAGLVYIAVHNRFSYLGNFEPVSIISAVVTIVFLNTSFMSALWQLLGEGKFLSIWFSNFKDMILNDAAVCILGVIIAVAYRNYGYGAVILFFVPLMLARYSFKLYVDMKKYYYDTVKALINAVEAKDAYTSGHATRVGEYSVSIAEELKLSFAQIDLIKNAAMLHDIGKIGIEDSILNKQDKLSELEYQVIKNHPTIGYDIIKEVGFLGKVMDIVRHHHERWDGKGYPDGLKGEEISIETSILIIADAFDAMTTDRPYRKALSLDAALLEVSRNAGIQFNPSITDKAIFALKKTFHGKEEKERGIA